MPRHDHRQNPIADRFGLPAQEFVTPNINDVVVIEELPLVVGDVPILNGTPRTGDTAKLLVDQKYISKGGTNERNVRRIYAAPRSAQDFYNAIYKYTSEDNSSQVFVRVYFELRSTYTARTKGNPLDTVINLALTTGGTGYTRATVAVGFSGGGGTGAAAVAEVQNGVVVSLQITNGGSGYTSAPTVAITGGTGATATASVQAGALNSSCILVAEEAVAADGELGSLFLKVTRVYMTLPGPWIIDYPVEPETRVSIQSKHRKCYSPDVVYFDVTDGVTNGTGIVTSATAGFTAACVGSVLYISGSSVTPQYRTIVSRQSSTQITLDAAIAAAGGSRRLQVGRNPRQIPYYNHTFAGNEQYQYVATESLQTFNSGSAPDYRVEYGWTEYFFPTLLFGFSVSSIEGRDGTAQIQVTPNRRSGFSRIVRKRTVITYGARGTLTAATVFAPTLKDCVYSGVAFSVNERNVLCDTIGSFGYTSGTENPKWPYFVETISFSATPLTATAYLAVTAASATPATPDVQAAAELCIGSPITPWLFGLDRMETTYVVAL